MYGWKTALLRRNKLLFLYALLWLLAASISWLLMRVFVLLLLFLTPKQIKRITIREKRIGHTKIKSHHDDVICTKHTLANNVILWNINVDAPAWLKINYTVHPSLQNPFIVHIGLSSQYLSALFILLYYSYYYIFTIYCRLAG